MAKMAKMATAGRFERLEARVGMLPQPGRNAARREVLHYLRRLVVLLALLTVLVLGGAVLLSVFEHVSYWRGLLWALDTVATIGSIPDPNSVGGQLTKIALIVFGVGTMFFALVTLTEFFVTGDLSGVLESRRMQNKIAHLKDHYLICGFGRVGQQIAQDLKNARASFVVIDDNPEMRAEAGERGVLLVEGRGSDDEVLKEAGIERARAVIACMDSDAENIFTTLTARELRPDVQIVARAARDSSERKLLRAGADEVVSPYKASGRTMASLALASHDGRAGSATARKQGAVVSGEDQEPSSPIPG
jgi:voltage-gated potassium channel